MALFDPTKWFFIAAFFLGAIILAIVLCIVICLCRRRCKKRRISEALQMQENYLESNATNKAYNNSNSISSKPTNSPAGRAGHTPNRMKSVTMINVAEESDENDDDDEDDDDDDNKQQFNGTNLNPNPKAQSKRHHILDLSSDVTKSEENNSAQCKPYKNRKYGSKAGSTPMMKDTQSNSNPTGMMQNLSDNVMSNSNKHAQQTSFVLDSDLDYYAQVQQMGTDRVRTGSEYSRNQMNQQASFGVTSYPKTNTDILDDDEEDPDIEFDYGSQM